jgi:DNA-binding PucR family transcriptional regulator
MQKRIILWVGCLLLVSHFGCASQTRSKAINNDDYLILQQQLKVANASKNQCRKKQEALRKKQGALRKKQVRLRKQVETLRAENRALSQKNMTLNKIIKNKEAVLSIQESVIRLFDDSKQTLQNSIREQIAAQNLEP